MRYIHFDSVGGAAGDMILGALIGLGADINVLNKELSAMLPEEHFKIIVKQKSSCGIVGIEAAVEIEEHAHHHHHAHHDDRQHHHGHHHHRTFADIRKIVEQSQLPEPVKVSTIEVFSALAEAEGKVHGKPADEVHFHEVGAVDSIVDITGCCLGMHLLNIAGVSVSALPIGQGTVKCQHGIYPLPAPATAALLKGMETVRSGENSEMVTPTGAALLKVWTAKPVPAQVAIVETVDSFGHRDFSTRPNLLRAMLLEDSAGTVQDECLLLETNIDDCSPEVIGAVTGKLLDAGALDVWTAAIQMKKQRPGFILSVLCKPEVADFLSAIIFRETTTFGLRKQQIKRQCLERRFVSVETEYGPVRIKVGDFAGEEVTASPEFADCSNAAAEHKVAIKTVINSALAAYHNLDKE
jgi:uncharacterized protein (TIGR00299 family) protein